MSASFLQALGAGIVEVVFQPIFELVGRTVLGYEALCRPPAGMAGPSALFPKTIRSGTALEADRACCRLAGQGSGSLAGSLFLNLTAPSFLYGPGVLEGFEADPARVVVEVTEHGPPPSAANLEKAGRRWRQAGFRVAADDVAPVRGRLEGVRRLAPDFVKIGRRLLAQAVRGEARALEKVLGLARSCGAQVVAEGIETPRHLDYVKAAGIGLGQGYLLGRPAPAPNWRLVVA